MLRKHCIETVPGKCIEAHRNWNTTNEQAAPSVIASFRLILLSFHQFKAGLRKHWRGHEITLGGAEMSIPSPYLTDWFRMTFWPNVLNSNIHINIDVFSRLNSSAIIVTLKNKGLTFYFSFVHYTGQYITSAYNNNNNNNNSSSITVVVVVVK